MKTFNSLALILTVVLGTSLSVRADHRDDQVVSSAKKSYTFRHYLKGDHVKVTSNKGIVTLSGTVSSESHRQLAYETLIAMSDVTQVNNELKIVGKVPDANSDAAVGNLVKDILRFHGNVSVVTHVDVKSGVVTLRGKAYSEDQKAWATEYARDVEGVKDVDNKMTVYSPAKKIPKAPSMDDASVTAEVKASLRSHRSTSAVISHVKTVDGVVTIAGDASNNDEKDHVTKIVQDVDGVKKVINNMTTK